MAEKLICSVCGEPISINGCKLHNGMCYGCYLEDKEQLKREERRFDMVEYVNKIFKDYVDFNKGVSK
jgi:NMD protein affecting ribosome stability and mRNA decay